MEETIDEIENKLLRSKVEYCKNCKDNTEYEITEEYPNATETIIIVDAVKLLQIHEDLICIKLTFYENKLYDINVIFRFKSDIVNGLIVKFNKLYGEGYHMDTFGTMYSEGCSWLFNDQGYPQNVERKSFQGLYLMLCSLEQTNVFHHNPFIYLSLSDSRVKKKVEKKEKEINHQKWEEKRKKSF